MADGLEIGRLIGYVELDDAGVAQGAQSVKDRLTDLAGEGKSIGSLIGKGAGVAIAAGLAGAMALEPAKARLTAQLDVTAEESERIGGVAGRLYSDAYGESLEDVNNAIRATVQNIEGMGDASSATLERIAGKVLAVSATFDQDLGQTTRAVGTMLRTGLAKDADQALDLLTRGFQNGTNVADDLLDTFAEYSTQFRKLGLEGPAAMGLLSQGLKGGARDADIVADALKELSIRAIDGSELTVGGYEALGLSASKMAQEFGKGGASAAGALDVVLDRLRAMPDPVARSSAAVALFGTQAEDLGDALFRMDASTAVKALGDYEGAAKRVADVTGGTAAAQFQAFTRTLQTFATDTLGETVLPVVTELGSTLLTVVTPPLEALGVVVGGLADGFDALPGPVQTTALTLATLVALRGPIASTFSTIKTGARDALEWTAYGAVLAIDGLTGVGRAADDVDARTRRTVRGGLSGLVGMLGGPLGAAIAAATIAVPLLSSLFDDNGDEAAKAARANTKLADAIRETGGAIDDSVRAAAAKDLEDKGLLETAEDLGVSLRAVTDAALGNADALEEVRAATERAAQARMDAAAGNTEDAGVVGTLEAQRKLIDGLEELAPTVAETAAEQKRLAAATGEAEEAEAGLEGQLAATNAEGAEQVDVLEQLTNLFEAVTGGAQSMAGAQLDVADGLAAIGEQAADAGTSLDRNTEAGRNNERAILGQVDAIEGLASATLSATGSSDLARQAYEREVGALRGRLVELGYSAEAVDELLARYAAIPEAEWTSIEQPGMSSAQQAADLLRDKVLGIPDGKTVHTSALTGGSIAALEALGYKVDHLPDGTVNVTAGTSAAERDIAYLARMREVELRIVPKGPTGGPAYRANGGWIPLAAGGLVERFADGGWHDAARAQGLTPATTGVADVAGPDTWRVYGDRPDVDEFYLPDNDDPRTMAYGAEWLRRRGLAAVPLARFAAGGMASSSSSSASSAPAAALGDVLAGLTLLRVDGHVYGDAHLRELLDDALARLDAALTDAGVHA